MRTLLQYLKEEGAFGWNWLHLIKNPHKIFVEIYYHTKWFIQRGKRGYADCDVWSIDWYLSSWIPKALRQLDKGHGFPVQVYMDLYPLAEPWGNWPEENCEKARTRWKEIVEEIAKGFEASHKIQNLEIDLANAEAEMAELQRQMKAGLELFSKYYLNLWD